MFDKIIHSLSVLVLAVSTSVMSMVTTEPSPTPEIPAPSPAVIVEESPSPQATIIPSVVPTQIPSASVSASVRPTVKHDEPVPVPINVDGKSELCKQKIREVEASFAIKLQEGGDPVERQMREIGQVEFDYCRPELEQ